MIRTAATNTSSENATGPSRIIPSKAEGVALCAAFILTFVFIVVGNLLTIVLFVVNRRLRKRSLFLVINMAFSDLLLGAVSLPIYIYLVGISYELCKGGWSMSLTIFYQIIDIFFSQASLLSAAFISGERFYAIYWPFKHRTLSMRAYSPYRRPLEYNVFLDFIQTCCIFLDAIRLDHNIHHMWL